MIPEEIARENLKNRVLEGVLEAFVRMDGFNDNGGKIIVTIPRPILQERRVIKINAFQEWNA
jgi:hypothetical protein